MSEIILKMEDNKNYRNLFTLNLEVPARTMHPS